MLFLQNISYLNSLEEEKFFLDRNITITRLETLKNISRQNKRKLEGISRFLNKRDFWIYVYRFPITPFTYSFSFKELDWVRLQLMGSKGLSNFIDLRLNFALDVIFYIIFTIFNEKFFDFSHGANLNKSPQSCVLQIINEFRDVDWILKIDLNNFCLKSNQSRLIVTKTLKQYIDDKKFFSILKIFLKQTELKFQFIPFENKKYYEKDSFINVFLTNVIFHQLDRFLLRLNTITASTLGNKGRVYFTRFNTQILVGISGQRYLKNRIKNIILVFINKILFLEKDNIIYKAFDIIKTGIPFLGFVIKFKNKAKPTVLVDNSYLIEYLFLNGFCNKDKKSKPCFKFFHFPQDVSVNLANKFIVKLVDYYSICNDIKSSINFILFLIKGSLAKMFAAKFKLKTQRQVFKLSNKDFSKPLKVSDRSQWSKKSRLYSQKELRLFHMKLHLKYKRS